MTAAIRYPDRTAIVDERGTLTFAEVDARTNALAHALAQTRDRRRRRRGRSCAATIAASSSATVAVVKLGADALFLNTEFGAPAIAGVLERERTMALIYDEEFSAPGRRGGAQACTRFVAHHEPAARAAGHAVEELIVEGEPDAARARRRSAVAW